MQCVKFYGKYKILSGNHNVNSCYLYKLACFAYRAKFGSLGTVYLVTTHLKNQTAFLVLILLTTCLACPMMLCWPIFTLIP